jgi:hypothetical protein
LVLEASNNIRLTAKNSAIYIEASKIDLTKIPAAEQKGIYARFA